MRLLIFIVTAIFVMPHISLHSSELINVTKHGFIKNVGQLCSTDGLPANEILYYLHTNSKSIYLSKNKISYVFYDQSNFQELLSQFGYDPKTPILTDYVRIDIDFKGSSESAQIIEENHSSDKIIFHYAKNSEKRYDTYSCSELIYQDLYDGIDMNILIKDNYLKFSINADSPKDYLKVNISVNSLEDCFLSNNSISFQVFGREEVLFCPKIVSNETDHNYFMEYNSSLDLIRIISDSKDNQIYEIEMLYGTYIGGGSIDAVRDVAADKYGNYITVGYTLGFDFPVTSEAYQTKLNGDVDFIACYFSKENNLLWSTYIGGRNSDSGFGSVFDSNGNVWISGQTTGDFPRTQNCYQDRYQGGSADAVLLKLSQSGDMLFSTNFGGSAYEALINLCVDENDNIYGATETRSENFPVTSNAYQKIKSNFYDGYLIKCDNNGNVLLLTYYGADYDDSWDGIAIAKDGNPVIGGWSQSKSLIGRLNENHGLTDAYIAKLNKETGEPIWGRYIGGSNYDRGFNLTSDNNGDFIITGVTSSADFPVSNGFYPKIPIGGTDYFFAKVNDDGDVLFSSYFGGKGNDGKQDDYSRKGGIAVDNNNNFFFSGFTLSHDFPTKNLSGLESHIGDTDAFISLFSPEGALQWSGYIGGSGIDEGYDVCYDNIGQYILIGTTNSTDFPVSDNALQPQNNGQYDGFIVKFGEQDTAACDESYFEYPNFSVADKLTFVGNAFQYGDFIRLNSSNINKVGALWRSNRVPVKKGFTTKFNFSISEGENGIYDDGSAPGADGIAFVIQNEQERALGIWGGGIGYHNMKNCLAVEFDTFANDSLQIENFYDPNGNHIAVMSNGTEPNSSRHNSDAQIAIAEDIIEIIPDGRMYYARIDYNIKPNVMNIYLSENQYSNEPALTVENIDISSLLNLEDQEFAWVGFAAASGNSYENHDLHYWYFCPIPTEAILSVDDRKIIEQIKYYPNPFSDEITVDLNSSYGANISIAICDILGREFIATGSKYYNAGNHLIHIKTEVLTTGVYIMKIRSNDAIDYIKVISQGN